ncbi:MAG: hypothetical protein AAF598_12630, partial [Bacteroidota bacterium]
YRFHEMLIMFAPGVAFTVSAYAFFESNIDGILFPGFLLSAGMYLLLINGYLKRKRKPQIA